MPLDLSGAGTAGPVLGAPSGSPPSTSIDFKKGSPLHGRLLNMLNARFRLSAQRMSRLHKQWQLNEDQFLAYLPETETDSKRRILRENQGKPQYTTVVLPYTYAMLMSAHSYWTTVFLSRAPIFQYDGRHGEAQQQVQALEALIAYQVQVGKMLVPLYFWLLDAGKYGLGVTVNYWEDEVRSISSYSDVAIVDPITGYPAGTKRQLQTQMIPGYSGNKLVNVRPYDYYPDPRVPLWNVQKGEFVGYLTEVSGNALLRGKASGIYNSNVDLILQDPQAGGTTGREQGSTQIELPNDSQQLLSYDNKRVNVFGILTMYVELVPADYGLSPNTYPEKWVFTAKTSGGVPTQGQSSSLDLVIGAMPHGSFHGKFPVNVLEIEPEAYGFASRGMPQIMKPLQDAIDWLLNSHMYNVRKTLNNQFVVDPSRIIMKDILDPQAGGMIRLKASAYGTDAETALRQLQVQDVTRGHMSDIGILNDFGQRAVGINDQLQGMVEGGGRKTAQEIRASSTFGVNRQKTIAELGSAMGWDPLSDMLVADSQQNYQTPMKLRIVGDLILDPGATFLTVNPEDIAGSFDFIPVDGTMPIDRYAQANLWKEMLVAINQLPQIAMQYDIGRIFAWTAKLAGLKNITQFKVQVLPPGMGPPAGAIPMPTGGPPGPAGTAPSTLGNVIEPGQVPGMGPSG